jgi:hypothetical protein
MKKSAKSVPAAKAKPAAKPVTKAATKTIAKPAPAKKAAPAKQKPSSEPATFLSAQIDIGFGNHLYVRGEGPGLSWDHGLAMDNTGSNLWTATIKGAKLPVVFKVLVNDLTWNVGADYSVDAGQSITVYPTF